ncbi:MAG: DUF1648 domain-containing protein [Mobiluncus porci]|uniref:DUF1648 domain-containing protein n=1 Tax=Mobiluncus porci TaxID=2652278 RepID=UPI0023F54FC7|nr:DUF1648 domain-containing protein [Mobiluncus porci]MDD7541360.1 DUF1648 domain-containing protein [Mobiluncus porci]MDY5747843.1 DUF1648 domain-containing protein [Mobiluncus porci]
MSELINKRTFGGRPFPNPVAKRHQVGVFLAVVAVIGVVVAWVRIRALLPDSIPMHWNAAGEIDRYGNPDEMWIMVIIFAVLALAVLILVRFPQATNTLFSPKTDAGWQEYYGSVRDFSIGLSLVITALNLVMILTANPEWNLPIFWVCMPLALAVALIAVHLRRTHQLSKKK